MVEPMVEPMAEAPVDLGLPVVYNMCYQPGKHAGNQPTCHFCHFRLLHLSYHS